MRFLVGILFFFIGIGSLFLDELSHGPTGYSSLPFQMGGLAMAAAGLAVCFRRPQEGKVYAKAWQRILASVIDWTLISILTLLVGYFDDGLSFGFFLPLFALQVFSFVLMSVFCHAIFGMTPGKYLLKIRVVRTNLAPIGFREAMLRSTVDAVFATLLLAKFIRFVWIFGYPEYQAVMSGQRHLDMSMANPFCFLLITGFHNMWYMAEVAVMMLNGKRRSPQDFIAGTLVVNGRVNEWALAEAEVGKIPDPVNG